MSAEGRAALAEIAARLAELERQAEAAGLPMLAFLLAEARAEAEARLAGEGGAQSRDSR